MASGLCCGWSASAAEKEVGRRPFEQRKSALMDDRYFFHATEDRKNHAEYKQTVLDDDDGGSDTEPEDEDEDEQGIPERQTPSSSGPSPTSPVSTTDTQIVSEEDPSENPSLRDWFQVRDGRQVPGSGLDEDSATDPESDNDDTRDVEDDWFGVQTPDTIDDDIPEAVVSLPMDLYTAMRPLTTSPNSPNSTSVLRR